MEAKNLSVRFSQLNDHLNTLGFNANDKMSIYTVLAAVLNIGNIQFESRTDNESSFIKADSQIHLSNAALLLNIEEQELVDALVSKTRIIQSQPIR